MVVAVIFSYNRVLFGGIGIYLHFNNSQKNKEK